jgi:hypothetical protein
VEQTAYIFDAAYGKLPHNMPDQPVNLHRTSVVGEAMDPIGERKPQVTVD